VLLSEGFKALDPSHPLGGKDGGKDATCVRNGKIWVMAVFFPRGEQSILNIRQKFAGDVDGAKKHNANGIAFVTNQELVLHERRQLNDLASPLSLELYHLERLTAILDQPGMSAIRKQFLDISYQTILDKWWSFLTEHSRMLSISLVVLIAVGCLSWSLYGRYAPPSQQAVAQAIDRLRSATLGSTPPDLQNAISILQRAKAPLAGESLSGAWLVCQDLSRLDLRRVDASRLHGTGAQFRESLIFLGDFEDSELSVSSFRDADLASANFKGSSLIGASFQNANAPNTNFHGATLQTAILNGALFSGADMSNSDLTLAELRSANLKGAHLNDAVFESADVSGTNLTSARFLTQDMLNRACAQPSDPPILDPGMTPPPNACGTEPQQPGEPPERAIKQFLFRFIATQETIQGTCKNGHNEPRLFDREGHATRP
jgi:uncharacterized protein YjbI with pentapeptide repeats